MRSPEQWQLLAPRLEEICLLASPEGASHDPNLTRLECLRNRHISPSQYLFSGKSWDSWSRLARPIVPRHALSSRETPLPWSRLMTNRKTELAPLERMPAELLSLIVGSDALEKEDIISLGLSSSTLWQHAVRHVQHACYNAAASWANTPIACTGTYLTDLPPEFAKDYPEPPKPNLSTTGRYGYLDRMCWARKFNWAARSGYRQVHSPGSESQGWTTTLRKHLATMKVSALIMYQMEQDIAYEQLFASANPHSWVLRNLTTHEFVRCQAPSAGELAHVDYPDSEWIRVDDVLIMRICWSIGDRRVLYKISPLEVSRRGPWAGHSFEIVALQQKEMELMVDGEESWKDVTVKIVKEARRLTGNIHKRVSLDQEAGDAEPPSVKRPRRMVVKAVA